MSQLVDLVAAREEEQKKYFDNYLFYAQKIKKEAEKHAGKVRAYVFGSILIKDEVARDIDILVISNQLKSTKEKSVLRAKIWRQIGLFTPFELHFATPREYQDWYQFFLKKKVEI